MSIEIGTIQNGEIIKCGHDTFKVVEAKASYHDPENPTFLAVRFIKTRKTYAKQPSALRFYRSKAEKI